MNICQGMLNALQVFTRAREALDIARENGALGAKLTGRRRRRVIHRNLRRRHKKSPW